MAKSIRQRFSKLFKEVFRHPKRQERIVQAEETPVLNPVVQEEVVQMEVAQVQVEEVKAIQPFDLPAELLEHIFLYIAYSNRDLAKSLEPLMYVNRRWSAIACRLRYLKIALPDQDKADSFLKFIQQRDEAGEERVPVHHLNIPTPANKTTPDLLPILNVVSHSLRSLRINDQRASSKAEPTGVPFSDDPSPDISLPKLYKLELFWVHHINVLTLLGSVQTRLRCLCLSATHLDLVSVKPGMLEAMYFPSLIEMQLYSEVGGWESTRLALCNAAPILEVLDMTILRSEAASVAAWMKDYSLPTIKHVIIYIISSASQWNERSYDRDIKQLWDMTYVRGWSTKVVA